MIEFLVRRINFQDLLIGDLITLLPSQVRIPKSPYKREQSPPSKRRIRHHYRCFV